MKLTECLDRLLDEGLISNIAVRVGRFDTVLADVYRSAGQKIDENTRFDMASVTKVMVTTPLALMALEQGAIALDTPVSAFSRRSTRTDRAPSAHAHHRHRPQAAQSGWKHLR